VAFKPGQSGNPAGRKPGVIDRRQRIAQFFEGDGIEIARVVIEAAKKGDLQACALVLTRVAPPAKPRAERVSFKLDTTLPLAAQAGAVVQAIADGQLAPEEAQVILSCLTHYVSLKSADELDGRLRELERRTAVQDRLQRSAGNVVIDESPMALTVPGAATCDALPALQT
jgi:hypothetical protein